MAKIKNSLFSRVSAIVLVLTLIIGTIPTSVVSAKVVAEALGTVEVIDEVGGVIDNADSANIQINYEGEGVSIKHVEKDDSIGRTGSGWYVGAIMNVPDGIDFTYAEYTNADGIKTSLTDATNADLIYMWKEIDETVFATEKAAGNDLEFTWEYDWDTTTEGTQKVVFTIDTATVALSDEDTVKPVVETIAANPSEWTKDAVVISGTVSDNFSGVKSVSYKQEGTEEVKEATLTGNSFSFTVDATVYEGKYIVWCTDNKDNESEKKEVSVYMDNVAPTVTAKVDVTDWTKEAVTISGTVDDNLSGVKEIYYQKTGETKVKLETFDAANGTYSITIPTQEYAGIYTIYCVDNANNEASATVEVKMDNKAPEVTDVKADVTDWTKGSVVISGTVSDAVSGVASVTWTKEGDSTTGTATINKSTNTFSFEIDAQSYEGNYVITCTDNAGNATVGNTVSVKMDNGSCVVATGAADKADWTNSSVVISGTVSDDLSGVASVTWTKEDDQTTGSATFDADNNAYSFEVAAQNYNGKYIITCTDKAGNVSAEFSVAVQMDVDVPAVESAKADVTKWTNGSVVISGEVSDNLSGVASVTWKKADGKASGDATYSVADNTYTFTLDAQEYAGEYIIKCTDKAGNVSEEKKVAVKMDNVIPTLTAKADVTDWTNGSVVISGEVSDNLSGVVSVSYGKSGEKATDVTLEEGVTAYSITLEADDYHGNYKIYCTDAAGNVSATTEVEVKMDKTVPVVESAKADIEDWTKEKVTITGNCDDYLSGIAKIYYKQGINGETVEITNVVETENNKVEFKFEVPAQSYKGDFIIWCVDKAANVSVGEAVAVKMDNVRPHKFSALELVCGTSIWNEIVKKVTFGLFYNETQTMLVNTKDDLSGIKKIEYVEKEVVLDEIITEEIVEKLAGWKALYTAERERITNPPTVSGSVPVNEEINNRNVIYCVRVTDYANNVSYVTSDGLIIDKTNPAGGLADDAMVLPSELPMNGEEVVYVPSDADDVKRPLYSKAAVGEDGVVTFDVNITEETNDGVLQSGIKKVSYKVEAKDRDGEGYEYVITQGAEHDLANVTDGDLYTWNKKDALLTEFTDTIEVDAAKNNYNYVKVTVTVTDNAGNTISDEYVIAIDITAPTLTMKYDDDTLSEFVGTDDNGDKRGYYTEERKVYATYTERNENWNQDIASAAIKASIKNMAGAEAQYDIEWTPEPTKGKKSDEDTYYATITFKEEIHYSLAPWTYTDAAGNEVVLTIEGTEYPYVFSIDKFDDTKDSVAEITIKEETWLNKFLKTITFGVFDLFSNTNEEVTVKVTDDFAGIREIKYLEKEYKDIEKTDDKYTDTLTKEQVKAYEGWKTVTTKDTDKDLIEEFTETIEKTLDGKNINKDVVIFVQVTDYAGYNKVLSSDGVIIDTTNPAGGLTDSAMVLPAELPMNGEEVVYVPSDIEGDKRPLYGNAAFKEDDVVTFNVNITEETTDGVLQSGIKKVSYKVEAKDRNGEEYTYAITQGAEHDVDKVTDGDLYTWNKTDALLTEFTGTIGVDASLKANNHNYVKVTVTVTDNAGNTISDSYEIAIDRTAPEVKISYDPKVPVTEANDLGYFNCQRIATITYTERSENWNCVEAEKQVLKDNGSLERRDMIEALDINGEQVDGSYTIKWDDVLGTTSDEDTHIAIVSFNPTNILETEEEIEDVENTEDVTESDETTETTEPVTGADARYALDLSYTDEAGNSIAIDENGKFDESDVTVAVGTVYPFNFVIDTVSTEVASIEYKETIKDAIINTLTFNYFGANAQVTVTLKDITAGVNKFDYEGLLDSGISAKNKAVIKTAVEGAEIVQQQEDKSVFVVKFTIPKEALTELNSFRGTVRVNAWDYSNNTVQKHDETRLVVDKIAPTCQVTFDQPVKDVSGVSYYDKAFTATIVIDEANFYAEDVVINVNGQRVMPTDWTQTPGADIWTSHVTFTAENDYILTVNYTDRSGNVMTAYESNQRTLDTTEPVINVSNIKHESANNQETIGFTLTVTDKNMSLENVQPSVTAVVRKGESIANYTYERVKIDLGQPVVSTNDKGETVYTYTVSNLEIDGYYSLECTVVDHANHSVSNIGSVGANGNSVAVDVVNFSVNRGGSVFWIETEHNDKYSDKTFNNELNGAYANDKVTVKLHEVNVDPVDELEEEDKRTILTLNDGSDSKAVELVEKNNGTGNYDRNVAVGVGGWYETIYTLDNDQFAKDGTYSLNIITYDKAENSNVNTKNEEGTIKFVVDRTNPVVTTNVKTGQIIDAEKYTVEFTIAEVNLDEKTIVVKLEGKEQVYEKVSSNTFKFEVENLLNDEFTIEVKDLAGNSAGEFKIDDLTVSTKWYVRWFANKPLFWGTIGGTLGLTGLIIFLVVWKKRKKDGEA